MDQFPAGVITRSGARVWCAWAAFELDGTWHDKPPSEIKRLREQHLRPHVASFSAWVNEQRPLFKDQRGVARTALEYACNQQGALVRFFDDGRLVLTNNGAERAIKAIARGRKAWLFCGSDDHAKSHRCGLLARRLCATA